MRGPRGTLAAAAVAVAVSLGVSGPALAAGGAPGGGRPGGAAPAAVRLAAVRLAAAGPAAGRSAAAGPAVTLTAAQPVVTAERFGSVADVDPGIYAIARGAPLRFNVRKPGFAAPIRISRVIGGPGGPVREVPLPSSLADGFRGLRNFAVLTVRDPAGKIVTTRHLLFCPNAVDPQRVDPAGPQGSPFPRIGCPVLPFTRTTVWGLQRGWGEDMAESAGTGFRLAVGTYSLTETITAPFRTALGLPEATSSATVTVKVVRSLPGSDGEHRPHASGTLPRLPAVRTMTNPPRAALPDLVPLPSWGIQLKVRHRNSRHPAVDQLNFNATVAIDGNSPLDVQGFRPGKEPVMQAFQYFSLHGKIIGRAPAGTMAFDSSPDEQEWHFQQFAQYRLLNASRTTAALSHKEAFCIAPTDGYDLLRPGAVWRPAFTGLGDGNCGQATALWVPEQLPLGWGDTYTPGSDGQNFNVTGLPNGTYYIEIIANPERVLREMDMANDVSLRKIVLGGTPDHRTLRVPPFTAVP